MQEKNLEKLETILKLLNDSVTKEEFVKNFETVLKVVQDIKKRQEQAVQQIEQTYANLLTKQSSDHSTALTDLKGQVDEVFVGQRLNEIEARIDEALNRVLAAAAKVKDGKDGKPGRDGKDGKDGKPGRDGKDAPKDTNLDKRFDELRQEIARIPRRGTRKIPVVKRVNLTSQVNGSTRSFSLPQDTVEVLGVFGTQFPITFDNTDWTLSGHTLTLASGITTPAAGQTLFALVEVLFY